MLAQGGRKGMIAKADDHRQNDNPEQIALKLRHGINMLMYTMHRAETNDDLVR